ncbi:response regulator transcription factor [Romboutsia sedimentorum]|uniref:response regulator transcription factor n=1 Tax=Romboutsia sedimentorum TaxID=1368474 RepID=UPI0024DE361A|nr:response regulator transcription factor [Romboutsia sedimentorum]MDK2586388.1 response regulator transcription factor [Romboutsia sedimentorum]
MTDILIVDDEPKICEFVKAYLEKEGYNTQIAYDGNSALDYFDKNSYNLVILDRMIPDISGEEICKYIRQKSEVPIIMLTAKIEDEDRIDGFNFGCDDYICKPFNVKELVLRVKAILKRSINSEDKEILTFGDYLEINTLSHEVKVKQKEVLLTNTEYKILLRMACNPRRVYTREELLENTIDNNYEKVDRVIDSHMKNLRQKLQIDENIKIIQTVYGVGYKFGL